MDESVDYTALIDAAIEVLERLKQEPSAFQGDALWKIGDYIAQAVEEGETLDAGQLLADLRAFHNSVEEMVEKNPD